MSTIIIPGRWRRQPSGPVGIDRSNAITNGLSSALSGASGPYDLAKKASYALQSGVSSSATNKGIALSFNGSTDGLAGTGFVNTSSQWTMAALVNFASTAGYTTVWSTANAANAYASLLRLDNNSRLTVYQYDSGADPNASDPTTVSSGVDYFVVAAWSGSVLYLYKNGALVASTSVATMRGPSTTIRVGQDGTTNGKNAFTGTIPFTAYWDNRAFSGSEVSSLSENPWQIFRKSARILYFPSAGGGGATTGTGAPAAQSATVAGTATRTVTGSGAPAAQAATASGTAEREITSSGTPAAQSATVSGTGTVGAVVTGSGSPQAQSATVAGTAEREVTASGTPSAQSATVAGTAEREITSSGTPTAQSATVVGTGQVGNIITGSGTPTAQSATVSGTAEREITASGTVSASSATVVGAAERTITGTGTLSASSATVYGFDTAPVSAGNPTSGGGIGRVYSSKKLRKEVDEWLEKQQESERQKILARIQREDEELLVIMLALAA